MKGETLDTEKRTENLAVLAIWVLILFWVGVKSGDLRSDPLAYAVIAKNMALENQWLNPNLMGEPYLNKPPLYFWINAFFFKVFGVSYYISKLPSLLFSALDVFILYFLAFRWFKDRDIAFFTAFSFMSTRWVVRDFASSRPESLFVFGLLLGLWGFSLMLEEKKSGPYLFGIALAIMVMTKFSMALVLVVPTGIHSVIRRKFLLWLKWPHFYTGLLVGAALPAAWICYFEMLHGGYFSHMLYNQTIERMKEGLDVQKSQLLYLKEIIFYYHPWLIFFGFGVIVMWRTRRHDFVFLTLIAVAALAVILQASTGKASRYLIPATPFLSMVAAHGVVRFVRLSSYIKKAIFYAGPLVLVFFWVVPVTVNPLVYQTVHFAADLQKQKPSYKGALVFLKRERQIADTLPLVEWRHPGNTAEYEYSNYFYLPASRRIWTDAELEDFAKKGNEKIFLIAPTPFLSLLPDGDRVAWTKIYSDKTATLLLGDNTR